MKSAALPLALVLLLTAGCRSRPKPADITPLQRKQAASLVSEADFAATTKDLPRAEDLYRKATDLCPDVPAYWEDLGMAQRRRGDYKGARKAYGEALALYEDRYARKKNPDDLLHRILLLALLGRDDEAIDLIRKTQGDYPSDPGLRQVRDPKWLQNAHASPTFKDIAL
ncbi:MAG TPA: tetratricopeptide repeat protein [Opitutaceae bacterium]|nr:tetratricopeptide repeat protein [Opitutaceae bacterium]